MRRLTEYLFLLVGVLVLLGMAVQYPLQTSFPMGNDPTRFILRGQEVRELTVTAPERAIRAIAKNSAYPATIALFALSDLLPVAWPELFTW